MNPSSTPMSDEELRKKIVGSLSRAQVQNVDVMGEATIEREADHIMRLVALHTKEAVEAERKAMNIQLEAALRVSEDNNKMMRNALDILNKTRVELAAPAIPKTDMEGGAEK